MQHAHYCSKMSTCYALSRTVNLPEMFTLKYTHHNLWATQDPHQWGIEILYGNMFVKQVRRTIFVSAFKVKSSMEKTSNRSFTTWVQDVSILSLTLLCKDLAFKERRTVRTAAVVLSIKGNNPHCSSLLRSDIIAGHFKCVEKSNN